MILIYWLKLFSLPPGCFKISYVFSHAQSVVLCKGCNNVLCQPTGGKARLTDGKLLFAQRYFVFNIEEGVQLNLFLHFLLVLVNYKFLHCLVYTLQKCIILQLSQFLHVHILFSMSYFCFIKYWQTLVFRKRWLIYCEIVKMYLPN